MKIAYLILCHTDSNHIKRLTDKITNRTNDEAFVHVDGKCDIKPFEQKMQDNPQVHIIKERVCVHWGGYSSIEATINLFKAALASKKNKFDRFVVLQGLEYPIKTNREIHTFFEKNFETEFILAQNISRSSDPKEIHKYSLYWYLDSANSFWAKLVHILNYKAFLGPRIIPHFKKNYTVGLFGEKLEIFQGCAQFGVTRKLAEYIVKFYDENKMFNKYFQTMYAPDEAYFHTIVYNSPFVNNTPDGKAITRPHLTDFENLTYFEYPTTVTLFTKKSDWPKLRDSGFLYFRKASSESKELLDYIDKQHVLEEEQGAENNSENGRENTL